MSQTSGISDLQDVEGCWSRKRIEPFPGWRSGRRSHLVLQVSVVGLKIKGCGFLLTFFYACCVVAGNKQRKRDEEEVSADLLLKILNLGGGFHWG